jgi:hypothetical protein
MGNENNEAVVDELSKPGNESALEDALNKEINTVPGFQPNFDPPTGDQETDQPPDDDPKDTDKGDDPSNEGGKKDQEPSKKTADDRFKDILSDRNEAKDIAAEAQQESKVKDKRIKDLEDENARLNKQKGGDDDDPADDSDPFKGMTPQQIADQAAEKVKAELKKESDAEKSDNDEIDRLITSDPTAEESKGKIKKVMEKHPTVSAVAAYAMIKGVESGESGDSPSNANKLGLSGRSKKGIGEKKTPNQMSTKELELEVQRMYKSGELII